MEIIIGNVTFEITCFQTLRNVGVMTARPASTGPFINGLLLEQGEGSELEIVSWLKSPLSVMKKICQLDIAQLTDSCNQNILTAMMNQIEFYLTKNDLMLGPMIHFARQNGELKIAFEDMLSTCLNRLGFTTQFMKYLFTVMDRMDSYG